MKRYGIIGGTFDPIHNAHLYIAYEAKKQLDLDNVVFMPAGIQPFKKENKVTDSELRYNMVKLAIEPYKEFSISDYEIEKFFLLFTYETLEYFKENYNNEKVDLFFITGADCLMSIDKWKNVSKIFSLCTFVVFSRGGFNSEDLSKKKKEVEEKYSCKIVILELKELEISSTDIRERVKNGRKIDFFVPEKVNKFILENNLYK
ncbi:Nicotinate-nucleotide adenylyltransferase [Clostridium sp. IBUN22A]|uniref:nicotinate-nucleotide adenylyltransferase n=1 Tax=Clostridium sp. IBUN22A TaxID=1523155 RepID=UPI0005FAC615|nr:nicotinate-nucleotide adenylyltransferase [Clostridium sp. IBUN22A]KJZ91453.1 Nicotinate-nucleotide adenylyltransferase [Clostridium sp. IBUN22A]